MMIQMGIEMKRFFLSSMNWIKGTNGLIQNAGQKQIRDWGASKILRHWRRKFIRRNMILYE